VLIRGSAATLPLIAGRVDHNARQAGTGQPMVYVYGIDLSSSPVSAASLKSSTNRCPVTRVPRGPSGVIVTVIVPVSPGWRTSGVNGGGSGSTAASQRSPVGVVTAGSKIRQREANVGLPDRVSHAGR
jgi:hypothetical protein